MSSDRFSRGDARFVAICALLALASLAIVTRYWNAAFPEASMELRYDRKGSTPLAERALSHLALSHDGMKHTAVFDANQTARIFLERSLGLEKANAIVSSDVRVWFWRHRWFKPLQEEEYRVDVATTGELLGFTRKLPEAQPLPATDSKTARATAETFLAFAGVNAADLQLVSESERQLPKRLQRIYTWESKSIRPAGAPYRFSVTVDGNAVTSYSRGLKVPEEWLRSYADLRSKNFAAGNVDIIFMVVTMLGAIVVFIARIKRGDLHVKFAIAIGVVAFILSLGVAINSYPQVLAYYDTTSSYASHLAGFIASSLVQGIGSAMLLVVICGAGEVLYRERLPKQLALPRLWDKRVLGSRQFFRALILGYALVAIFMAYQVVFYLVAARFGAWSPADVPYDDMLNSAFPWVAVLFAGFFPAFSEEFLSRAFSIPFFQRFVRSRLFAYIIAGFIWGFGHATYPNQPFYIRGVEVGIAGVALGFLMDRFGIVALLVWHYTVDAVYTALILIASGNTYYQVSGSLSALIFAIPLVVSIALLIRNRGFLPDDSLTNAALPVLPPPPVAEDVEVVAELPPPARVRPFAIAIALVAMIAAAVLFFVGVPSLDKVADYRITRDQAKQIATREMNALRQPIPARTIADPVAGFRSWNPQSPHEDGGAPGGFDTVAAEHLVRSGVSLDRLSALMERQIPTATWIVRYFTPSQKREYFVEVDPRTSRIVGYHKYEDETTAGARLDQPAALAIARQAFARYGADVNAFTVQEALSFQQPNRRDWLFHFAEKTPIAKESHRRISVRVMGAEVTQFTTTIKVPEGVYRAASEQTFVNTALSIVQLVGILTGLSLVIAGFVIATRKERLPWKRALFWTAVLLPLVLVSYFARHESRYFGYDTSIAWETFRLGLVTNAIQGLGLRIGGLFMAIAGILVAFPHAPALLSREGRNRFGRGAAFLAVGAVAIAALLKPIGYLLTRAWPAGLSLDPVEASSLVAVRLPSLLVLSESILAATYLTGAVALFAAAISPMRRRRWLPAAVTMFVLFNVALESGATAAQMPVMLAGAAIFTAFTWITVRYVLGRNLLAWPVAIFTGVALDRGIAMVSQQRPDLVMHGTIVLAAVFILLATLSTGREAATARAALAPRIPDKLEGA